ncbi:hypothetical protein [Pseudolysinimonas sp.]|uniref:deoxynucleotide monophosphate kinase family protein n=1 Tax=Pseudolysinimonas sp. TaxID=2680009 RepID=UPI003F7D4DFB
MTGRLIGLGGKMRAGKDTVAAHLVAEHGFVKVAFADPLREAMLALDPFIPTNAKSPTGSSFVSEGMHHRYSRVIDEVGYEQAKENPEVRQLLQRIGTEVGRRILGENVWADAARRRIQELRAAGHDVVVTDTRFPNEVDLINELGGLTVWVSRPVRDLNELTTTVPQAHASESSVYDEDFERVIVNDSTLEALYSNASSLLAETMPARRAARTQLLLDGAVVVDLADVQPDDPKLAIVESWSTGPIVVVRSRLSIIA